MEFDKIVKKMHKKGEKLWSGEDIEKLITTQSQTKNTLYKTIHRLVSEGVITSIRKGWYIMADAPRDPEDYYWDIVRRTIAGQYGSRGVIIGQKALMIMFKDFSLPDTLVVSVAEHPRRLTILERHTLQAVIPKNRQKKSLYTLIKKHAKKISVDGSDLWITCPEHALLESFMVRGEEDDTYAIIRWLKKNAPTLREDIFGEFVSERYISSANRLKYLAIDENIPSLHRMMLDCIDRYGKGCHLSRGFLKT